MKIITLFVFLALTVFLHCEPITFSISTQEAIFKLNGQNFISADLRVDLFYDTDNIIIDPDNGGILYENSIARYTSNIANFQDIEGTQLLNIALRVSTAITIFSFSSGNETKTIFSDNLVAIGVGISNTVTTSAGHSRYEPGFSTYDGVSDFFTDSSTITTGVGEISFDFQDHNSTTTSNPIFDTLTSGQVLEIDRLVGLFFGSGSTLSFTANGPDVPEPQTYVLLFIMGILLFFHRRAQNKSI